MRKLEVLVGNVDGLKELLRIAWRDLANPLLTAFERREARNQINQYSVKLRRHLPADTERLRASKNSTEGCCELAEPSLQLLSRGC